MNNYWILWYSREEDRPFELQTPWWITGESDCNDVPCEIIGAALKARDEKDAMEQVYKAHDVRPESIDFRLIEKQRDDWNPLADTTGRYPPKKWMKWPPPGNKEVSHEK